MAVNPETTETNYALAGVALGPFNTVWTCNDPSEVIVTLNTFEDDILIVDVDYTVASANPLANGLDITLAAHLAGAGWPAGASVTFRRVTATGQPSRFGEAVGFSPQAAEAAMDYLARQTQETETRMSRTVRAAPGERLKPLSTARNRVNSVLAFDSVGDTETIPLADLARGPQGNPGGNVMAVGPVSGLGAVVMPAGANLMQADGYYTDGDGVTPKYVRRNAQPAHPGRVRTADRFLVNGTVDNANGGWWELLPEPLGVNVRALGAKLDAAANDDAAIDNAVLVARAIACLAVYSPAGVAKLTTSKDFTYSTVGAHLLTLNGDGPGVSIWDFSTQGEAYPSVDFSGNQGGRIRGMTLRATGNACLATTLFLAAKNANNFTGNNGLIEACEFLFPRTGYHANNYAGAVIARVDRWQIKNATAKGPRGWVLGPLPASVVSKFQATAAQFDWTLCTVADVVGIGSAGPGLLTAGSLLCNGTNYFALEASGGAVSSCIVDVNSLGQAAGAGKEVQGTFRTENQSGAAGVIAVKFTEGARGWSLAGRLESDGAGFALGGAAGLAGSFLQIDSNAAMFSNDFTANGLFIVTGSISTLGTPAAGAVKNIIIMGGGITSANLIAQGVTNFTLFRNDGTRITSGDEAMALTRSGYLLQRMGFGTREATAAAYATAGAEQLVWSWTAPAGIACDESVGGHGAAGYNYRVDGNQTAGAAINGRIRLEAVQGVDVVDIFDTGAALPAGQMNFSIEGEIFSLSGVLGMRAKAHGIFGGISPIVTAAVNLQAFGLRGDADITLNLYVTNANAAAFQFSHRKDWRG